jgi:hypothetical protein
VVWGPYGPYKALTFSQSLGSIVALARVDFGPYTGPGAWTQGYWGNEWNTVFAYGWASASHRIDILEVVPY